jgi:hypothetical protein
MKKRILFGALVFQSCLAPLIVVDPGIELNKLT